MKPRDRLRQIELEIAKSKKRLELLHKERQAYRTLPKRSIKDPRLAEKGLDPKTYSLVAQGDSWFDYPPSWDLIDWLSNRHGHDIDNIGVSGSTLNDIAYGRIPENWLGVRQSHHTDRVEELIYRIRVKKPQAVLLSGGGNDVAGPEFFSFLNNALSKLKNPNENVLEGVLQETFVKAYEDLIDIITAKAQQMGYTLPIFVHGYDYPWPDGRGCTILNLVGPWFDDAFNKKNYPYGGDEAKLKVRYNILKVFMDGLNDMMAGLEKKYSGVVHYIDLRGTLRSKNDWANELHPKREGFGMMASKINLALRMVLK